MVIAEVRPEGHVRVVERVKEMVRLGRRAFTTGRLSAEAMDLAVRAVQDFGRLARARRVDPLRAAAPGGGREGRDGPRPGPPRARGTRARGRGPPGPRGA